MVEEGSLTRKRLLLENISCKRNWRGRSRIGERASNRMCLQLKRGEGGLPVMQVLVMQVPVMLMTTMMEIQMKTSKKPWAQTSWIATAKRKKAIQNGLRG